MQVNVSVGRRAGEGDNQGADICTTRYKALETDVHSTRFATQVRLVQSEHS